MIKKILVDHQFLYLLDQHNYHISTLGYVYRAAGKRGKVIYLHREILNAPLHLEVDHINRNKLDNRMQNLRLCTKSQNAMNRPKQRNNTSGFKGVYWHNETKKWRAMLKFEGKVVHIGLFKDKKRAALAYQEKAKTLFKEFAYAL